MSIPFAAMCLKVKRHRFLFSCSAFSTSIWGSVVVSMSQRCPVTGSREGGKSMRLLRCLGVVASPGVLQSLLQLRSVTCSYRIASRLKSLVPSLGTYMKGQRERGLPGSRWAIQTPSTSVMFTASVGETFVLGRYEQNLSSAIGEELSVMLPLLFDEILL
eukprot:Blabericola_migrator_1__2140@NODE_1591_length_4215_cov_90_581003_g364_i3_p3_GENE_NODE_1591_length_4215_cov_90_581003_g364_i3NODE_1591_length_4215_cov_90_581003_g364_i3_p3_ORF_typecomplete_len160_score4_57_NODE_1591_length_4215_cov_90_581003_g364_i316832162